MSAPCSISDAVEILNELGRQQTTTVSSSPVDILGVVVNQTLLPSNVASAVSAKADIWIVDQSILPDVSARVTLYGSSELAKITEEQIKPGDIVRFNGVTLSKNNAEKSLHFQQKSSNFEPAPGWFRLGHVDDAKSWTQKKENGGRRIHETMLTPNKVVSDLTEWFQKNRKDATNTALLPLPCKRRGLDEIQSSVGLLSNVVVRVTQYNFQSNATTGTPKKRKLLGPAPSSSPAVFATITDSTGSAMSLVDLGSRFASILRSAKETGQALMLTSLVSRRQNDVYGKDFSTDDVVLVPTKGTTATELSQMDSTQNGKESQISRLSERSIPSVSQNLVTLLSGLRDIEVDGKSIKDNTLFKTPSQMLSAIVRDDDTYHSAIVYLDNDTFLDGQSGTGLYTRPEILQTLLGGISAENLNKHKDLHSCTSKLFRALLEDSVVIEWTLSTRNDRLEVVKVALSKL